LHFQTLDASITLMDIENMFFIVGVLLYDVVLEMFWKIYVWKQHGLSLMPPNENKVLKWDAIECACLDDDGICTK